MVVCHHNLHLCGWVSLKKKKKKKFFFFFFFFRETPTSPWVPFRAKFRPLKRLFRPSRPLAWSLQFVHTAYLFHFSRKWYIWIIFRLTDFNPISINGLLLLIKTKYFAIFFFHVTWTHIFFVWPYQNKRLNCWYLFYSLTRQTDRKGRQADRQQSSDLYNLMQMEVFFLIKTHLASVYADCNE